MMSFMLSGCMPVSPYAILYHLYIVYVLKGISLLYEVVCITGFYTTLSFHFFT